MSILPIKIKSAQALSLLQFSCRFTHDIPVYLAAKTQDIRTLKASEISDIPPFYSPSVVNPHPEFESVDLNTSCPVFTETGECRCVPVASQILHAQSECCDRYGFKCRFLGGHFRVDDYGKPALVVDEKQKAHAAVTAREVNFIGSEVQKQLHSRKVFPPIFHVDNVDLSFC